MGKVFISYSHKDEEWKERLRSHLGVLERTGRITVWDDRCIDGGEDWYPSIIDAMKNAEVAICLVSPDFLKSKFVYEEEIPYLIKKREKEGMVLLPVLVRPCLWKAVDWLPPIQMLPRDGKSISADFKGNEDTPLQEVAQRVFDIVETRDYVVPVPLSPRWEALADDCVEIERLPKTGTDIFGRSKELEILNDAWDTENTNIISFVAWGGVGKSAMVNKWVEQMGEDNWRGAERVYAWSFYSQGTGERVTSSEMFVNNTLKWFGDDEMADSDKSVWIKGRRLAQLIQEQKVLLILDGLEPLQSGYEHDKGKVTDPALSVILGELAKENPGLCVVTTREALTGSYAEKDSVKQFNLEQISDGAGRALLRVGGIRGTDAQLEEATRKFGNHALAINLLVAYLQDMPGRNIKNVDSIGDLDIPEKDGKHPRRVMEAFVERFGDSPEIDVLGMIGLFDRPAEAGAIEAIKAEPAIDELTSNIVELSEDDWNRVIENLRSVRLIAPASHHNVGALDAHPIVRVHFGAKLKDNKLEAWREAHGRLYEYYKGLPEKLYKKKLPDTLEEMEPLFRAVYHGCAAGRHQKTFDDVYYPRIQRGGKINYCCKQLGAYGADLAAMAGFFEKCWSQPAEGLREGSKAGVLNWAGFRLWALGRLREAVEPTRASVERAIELEGWVNAASGSGSLSELNLGLGEVEKAVEFAQKGVEFADRSGDQFWRMGSRVQLADGLHHAGKIKESKELFGEAEGMQKERQPEYENLYSYQGFRFCDLLLSQGEYREVKRRAAQTLEIAKEYLGRGLGLFDIALDKVSLGRAYMLEAIEEGTDDFGEARGYLDGALEGLRKAGQQYHLPRGLIARAALYRNTGKYEKGWRDLEEAREIAERGEMKLFLADCALEAVKILLAQKKKKDARAELEKAKGLVEEMGYHRRDPEVEKLKEELGS